MIKAVRKSSTDSMYEDTKLENSHHCLPVNFFLQAKEIQGFYLFNFFKTFFLSKEERHWIILTVKKTPADFIQEKTSLTNNYH